MNCPRCLEQDVEFPVEITSWSMTLTPLEAFTDDKSVSHLHDPAVTVTCYRCPLGHELSITERGKCWCGWSAA